MASGPAPPSRGLGPASPGEQPPADLYPVGIGQAKVEQDHAGLGPAQRLASRGDVIHVVPAAAQPADELGGEPRSSSTTSTLVLALPAGCPAAGGEAGTVMRQR